jgi:hypothetical protein
MFPERPASLARLSDEAAARSLSRRFGDIAAAAKDLGVDRTDLRRLTWSNPAILDAAHDRMSLFLDQMWDEAVRGLDSRVARVRERAVDRMCADPRMLGSPFASGLSLFARAPRPRGPHLVKTTEASDAEKARVALEHLEHEVAVERELEREREREFAFEREQEQELWPATLVRTPAPTPAPITSLWPSGIRRPTRGRR